MKLNKILTTEKRPNGVARYGVSLVSERINPRINPTHWGRWIVVRYDMTKNWKPRMAAYSNGSYATAAEAWAEARRRTKMEG